MGLGRRCLLALVLTTRVRVCGSWDLCVRITRPADPRDPACLLGRAPWVFTFVGTDWRTATRPSCQSQTKPAGRRYVFFSPSLPAFMPPVSATARLSLFFLAFRNKKIEEGGCHRRIEEAHQCLVDGAVIE